MTEGGDRYAAGLAVRRAVLGDAHVARASAAVTPFDEDFQRFITEAAWGSVWSRPGFTRRERSLVTLALLAALGHDDELALHIRATRNTGRRTGGRGGGHAACGGLCRGPGRQSRRSSSSRRPMRPWRRRTGRRPGARRTHVMAHDGSYYQRDRAWHPPALTPEYKTSVLRAPRQALLSLDNTVSEMTGPVFGHDILGPLDDDLIRNWAKTGTRSASVSSCTDASSTRTGAGSKACCWSSGKPMRAGAIATTRKLTTRRSTPISEAAAAPSRDWTACIGSEP